MKTLVKKFFNTFGLDVVRHHKVPLEKAKAINPQQVGANLLKMLTYNEIDLVLDVGGNAGQFAGHLFEIGYEGKVVSFEPLSSAYQKLLEISKPNPNWIVAEQGAIGDHTGEIEINVANNSESSSILPMLQAHLDAAPRSAYIESEKVKIFKLDDLAQDYLSSSQNTLLKIDTQGYESKVLEGAKEILKRIKVIHLELALVPLYEGEETFETMLSKIENMGFYLYTLSPGFRDTRTGQLLQVMTTFVRK